MAKKPKRLVPLGPEQDDKETKAGPIPDGPAGEHLDRILKANALVTTYEREVDGLKANIKSTKDRLKKATGSLRSEIVDNDMRLPFAK